jgi:CDGSH-type Zn-finger protein/uncharacterized Fe-S cluster protein YjdI
MPRKIREYSDEAITVSFDVIRCIHAEKCIHGLPQVFAKDSRPWVDPSQASAEEVARVVEKCPTGALTYLRHDGGPQETVPGDVTVRLDPNGPLYVKGDVTVVDAEGETVFHGARIALCRCGDSEHKPFCDGKHVEAGFSDNGAIAKEPPASGDSSSGPLTITVAANGPLLMAGPYTVIGADSTPSRCAEKGALCRCGGSSTKPMCDGTHKGIGFLG